MQGGLGFESADQRFSNRIEAFSDLVFGFSLSLLAARLDVPPTAGEIFAVSRFVPFIGTFAIICVLWLEHYRVFRLGFVVSAFDIVTNFVFLFAVACLPYALQTIMRFRAEVASLDLYLGDLSLVFATLATLQLRALLAEKHEVEEKFRLGVWRRILAKYIVTLGAVVAIILLEINVLSPDRFGETLAPVILIIVLAVRFVAPRPPKALRQSVADLGGEGIEPPTNTV